EELLAALGGVHLSRRLGQLDVETVRHGPIVTPRHRPGRRWRRGRAAMTRRRASMAGNTAGVRRCWGAQDNPDPTGRWAVDETDVMVIGGGPAGENVADRVVQGGLSAVRVESELVGGECSYWACMP